MRFDPAAPPPVPPPLVRPAPPVKARPKFVPPPRRTDSESESRGGRGAGVAAAAQAMSDAMLGVLLRSGDPAVLAQTRRALVAYCTAHPHLADVRAAWAAFHAELQREITQPATPVPVTFPACEAAVPVAIKL